MLFETREKIEQIQTIAAAYARDIAQDEAIEFYQELASVMEMSATAIDEDMQRDG